ncbi:MAG: hypothetical protein C4B58_03090 [Deltaproteobacteria bacterium]|nr:MAG: hypothetical protein C4B58_03090 [Deltaproteobacteria bacterium]
MKTLIVCASKYGSTLEIGRWLAERLDGDCFVDKAESMPDSAKTWMDKKKVWDFAEKILERLERPFS